MYHVCTFSERPLINVYGTTFSKKGSDATFKCYIRNSYPPVERKLWRKGAGTKSEQTILKNDNKYSIQHFEHYLTLKVKSVNIDDSGTYTCVAENKFSGGNGSIILSVGSKYSLYLIRMPVKHRHGNLSFRMICFSSGTTPYNSNIHCVSILSLLGIKQISYS